MFIKYEIYTKKKGINLLKRRKRRTKQEKRGEKREKEGKKKERKKERKREFRFMLQNALFGM